MTTYETLEVDGHEIKVSNPEKVFFPALGATKLELVLYYRDVAAGALAGTRNRPTTLYRWPNGVEGEGFFQKRVPAGPDWLQTATVRFPSGRFAEMLVLADAAHILWAVNLGCIDFNPWPVRCTDVDHPDELRVDLDPTPGIPWEDVRRTALVAGEVLTEYGLQGFPKTSGKRGIHINCRIEPSWGFTTVRRAALAFAREVERRLPGVATTAWWKEERTGVFVDYNQNARDRTVASAYSVRPVAGGTVSCPLAWEEVPHVRMEDFTIRSVPPRFRDLGDPGADIDAHVGSIDALLELADRDERDGLGEAPWPPHFPKQREELPRVQPSRRRMA
jgi:bifunctional non-homologous end joining protein LigD